MEDFSHKQRGGNPYKALYCIILVVVMINLMSIPLISAANFDNSKSFDKDIGNYGKVKIKNLFGLGETIIELELKENTDECGTDCSADIEIIMHKQGILIEDVRFVGGDVKSYQFYIQTEEKEYDVEYYETVCDKEPYYTGENRDRLEYYLVNCKEVKKSRKEKEPLWKPYELGTEVEKGTYQVRLEGTKKFKITTDWQITSQGKRITEWAEWGGSYQNGYYQVIHATSVQEDAFNVGNVTIKDWGNGVWVINSTNSITAPDIARGEIMTTLYMPSTPFQNASLSKIINNITGITKIESPDIRDGDKRLVFIYQAVGYGGWTTSTGMGICNFTDTTNNYNVSIWSRLRQYDTTTVKTYFDAEANQLDSAGCGVSCTDTNLNFGDTSNNDTDNPTNLTLYFAEQQVRGGNGDAQALVTSTDDLECWYFTPHVSNPPSHSEYYYDFNINGSIPEMTFMEGDIYLNSPENNYISPSNEVQFNATATVTGGASIINISLWTNETGSWAVKNFTIIQNSKSDECNDNSVDWDNWANATAYAPYQGSQVNVRLMNETNGTGFGDGTNGYFQSRHDDSVSGAVLGRTAHWAYWLTDLNNGEDWNLTFEHSYQQWGNSPGFIGIWNGSMCGGGSGCGNQYADWYGEEFDLWTTLNVDGQGAVRQVYTVVIDSSKNNATLYNTTGLVQEIDLDTWVNDTWYMAWMGRTEHWGDGSYPGVWTEFFIYNITEEDYPTAGNISFTNTYTEGADWTCQACDTDGDCGFAPSNRSFTIDTAGPSITINLPTSLLDYGALSKNETLNWTVSDTNLDSIWWEYNGTNTTLNGAINETNFTLDPGDYNGTIWANDTVGNVYSSTINWLYKIFVNAETYNSSTFETATETISLNVTANSSLTAATLNYKNTSYTYAATQSGNVWSKTFDIPNGIATNTFNWSFTYAGDTIVSSSNTQTVAGTNFSICGGDGGSVAFLNFTFKDESDDSVINNGTIPSSTWNYWLGTGTVNKTYTLINNTANAEYAFCSTPPDRNLTIDYTLQYEDQEGDYIQRLLNPGALSFSNDTTDTVLYLLKSTDGIYVTFQVQDVSESPAAGVVVVGTRVIDSVTTVVASGTTDAAGAVTFFLDSDFEHTFVFTGTGYDVYTTSIYPTQSSYTVQLATGATSGINDYTQGISSSINPNNETLFNDTLYTFDFILTSNYWTVDSFGFVLRNSSDDSVASNTVSANGGTATVNYNVGNSSANIVMNYWWEINGNYTNGSRQWYVISSAGTDWSISNFFDDFSNYSSGEGLFGLGGFGKAIIVFLIIFVFVGLMSYKFGLVSPAGVASLAFGLVLFFDVGLGLMNEFNPISAVPNFPTIFMGLILAGTLFREVYR